MKKKLKQLVDYFTVRNVKINMNDNSPENIAELKRLEFVFYFRPVAASLLMFGLWLSLIWMPTWSYLASLSAELIFGIIGSLLLIGFITSVLAIMEGKRLETHLYF